MNAYTQSSKERLQRLTSGPAAVPVQTVRIERLPMTGDLVRQRFDQASEFYEDGHGMGCRLPNGEWLYVAETETQQPGGVK